MIAQTAPRSPARASWAVIARMADFITRHTASAGGVTRDDLLLLFSSAEMDRYFETAKAVARDGVNASAAEARRRGKGRQ